MGAEEGKCMVCPSCGKECYSAKFCPECGRKLHTVSGENEDTQVRCPKCRSVSITQYVGNPVRNDARVYRSALVRLIASLAEDKHIKQEATRGQACVCLQCGYQWYAKSQLLLDRHRVYLAELLGDKTEYTYPGAKGGYISVMEDFVRIYHSEHKVSTIPYEQITAAQFQKNLGPLYGWISIRYTKNRRKKFPVSFRDAEKDPCAVFYPYDQEETYYLIYNVLRAIAEENRRAGII